MSLIQRHKLIDENTLHSTLCNLPGEYEVIKQELNTQVCTSGAPRWYDRDFQYLYPLIDGVYVRTRLISAWCREYCCCDTLSAERSLLFR